MNPHIVLRGSAETLGLDYDNLRPFLALRFLNNFAFMQQGFDDERTKGLDGSKELGLFTCVVWTVGKDYPVTYHISCEGGPFEELDHWEDAVLGVAHSWAIEGLVKKFMNELMEEFAIEV